jgi:alanine dehydrogenase
VEAGGRGRFGLVAPSCGRASTSAAAFPLALLRFAHCHYGAWREGPRRAVNERVELARGVNIWRGRVVHPAVAAAVGETPLPLAELR